MKTIFRFYLVCLLIFQGIPDSSAQQSTFSRVFYDATYNAYVQAYGIVKTADHNYMIAGIKDNKALALKIDSAGSIQWSKTFDFIYSAFYALTTTMDSCVVFAGSVFNNMGTDSLFVVKMNSNGDTIWTRTFENGGISSIKQTSDGGFILTGIGSHPYESILVDKLDAAGNLSWTKLFSSDTLMMNASGVEQTPDNGYIVIGSAGNYPFYANGMFLMKLNPAGSVTWVKRQALHGLLGYDVRVTPEGIVSFLATSDSGFVVMKTDFSGNVLWSKCYSGFNFGPASNFPPKLHQTLDKGFVFTNALVNQESKMAKIDSAGNLLWSRILMLPISDLTPSDDRGYIVAGNGPIYGVIMGETFNPLIGIMKTDSVGNSTSCNYENAVNSGNYTISLSSIAFTTNPGGFAIQITIPVSDIILSAEDGCVPMTSAILENNSASPSISVFPNPSSGVFRIIANGFSSNEMQSIEIFNALGEMIYNSSGPGILLSSVDIGRAPNGIYYLKVLSENTIYSQKIMICHN